MDTDRLKIKPRRRTFRTLFFFRPLAVILALSFLPPEWGDWSLIPKVHAATTLTLKDLPHNCVQNGGNYLFQLLCNGDSSSSAPPSQALLDGIRTFESDSLTTFLGIHGLQESDKQAFYDYGRSGLRSQFRAFLLVRIASIVQKQPAERTANETVVYNWFLERVWAHEKHLYQSALDDRNAWAANHCTWKPDPDIAKAYNINYIPCVGSVLANNAPTMPYFVTAARKREWEELLAGLNDSKLSTSGSSSAHKVAARASSADGPKSPSGYTLFQMTNQQLPAIIGSVSAALTLPAITGGVVLGVPQLKYKVFPHRKAAVDLKEQRLGAADKNLPNESELNTRNLQNSVRNSISELQSEAEVDAVTDGVTEEFVAEGTSLLPRMAATDLAADLGTEIVTEGVAEIGADSAIDGAVAGLSATGIGIIVAVVVLLVSTAITFAVEEANAIQAELDALTELNNRARSNPPDLDAMLQDLEGSYKIQVAFAEICFPDIPSNLPLPAPTADSLIVQQINGQADITLADHFEYVDWGGHSWSPHLYHGWWTQNGSGTLPPEIPTPAGASRSFTYDALTPSIRYVDWDGNRRSATRIGTNFVITKANPVAGQEQIDTLVAPGQLDQIAKFRNTYISPWLRIMDSAGRKVTLSIAVPPTFFDLYSPEFHANAEYRGEWFQATGWPRPTVTFGSNPALPGVRYTSSADSPSNDHLGFAVIGCCNLPPDSGQPTPGTYPFSVQAVNLAGTASTLSSLKILEPVVPLSIELVSRPSDLPYLGLPVKYLFRAKGPGQVKFYTATTFDSGLQFIDHGDGTAEISGTPDGGSSAPCPPIAQGSCSIWATNENAFNYSNPTDNVHSAYYATLTLLNFRTPPAAVLDTTSVVFPAGSSASFTLTSHGAITPVSYDSCGLPFWATLTDNHDGTATLAGSPPAGYSLTQTYAIRANALGRAAASCTPNVKISTDRTPRPIGSGTLDFTVGQEGSQTFGVTGMVGPMVIKGATPRGLLFISNNDGTGRLQGTPAAGTGRDYTIPFTVLGTLTGTSTSWVKNGSVVVRIQEAPRMNLNAEYIMMEGAPGQYPIDAYGYPKIGDMKLTLPSGSMPAGVHLKAVTVASDLNGAGSIEGTPGPGTGGRTYPITLKAQNAAGATQTGTVIRVVRAGDTTHDGRVDCADVSLVKTALGSKPGGAKYDFFADVNRDGVIDVRDLAFVSSKLPAGTRCN